MKTKLGGLLIFIVAFVIGTNLGDSAPSAAPASATAPAVPATPGVAAGADAIAGDVVEVIDGDTVVVATAEGTEKWRLIGMNTPETKHPTKPVECYGPEASARAKALLTGARVSLERDPSQGDEDRYGRQLGYLYLVDGTLYNEIMIGEGYAYEYTYDAAYLHQARFKAAEGEARSRGLGLWDPQGCNGRP